MKVTYDPSIIAIYILSEYVGDGHDATSSDVLNEQSGKGDQPGKYIYLHRLGYRQGLNCIILEIKRNWYCGEGMCSTVSFNIFITKYRVNLGQW